MDYTVQRWAATVRKAAHFRHRRVERQGRCCEVIFKATLIAVDIARITKQLELHGESPYETLWTSA